MFTQFNRLLRDTDGTANVLFAVSLPPLIGIAALAVDMGSLYLAERRLQNVADAAAAAAVAASVDMTPEAAVNEVIADSHLDGIEIFELTEGEYTRDREIHYSDRFDPTSLYPNATRVVLRQEVPLFFGSLLAGSNITHVTANAMASRFDMAGFLLGSSVVNVQGNTGNSILSALAGSQLGLTQDDVDLLSNSLIDVLDFAEALGPLNGNEDKTFGEIFEADTTLNQAVNALAGAAPTPELAALFTRIGEQAGDEYMTLADLIDLGPLGDTDINDGRSGVEVDGYSLLRSLLEAAQGDSYEGSFSTSVAGLASVNVRFAGGYSEERSPWLTVDTAGDVTLRTSETRLLVDVRTGSLAGLPAPLNIPFYTELASAEAQMTDIVCRANDGTDGVYIDARPSIGTLALADVDTTNFADFSAPLWLDRATLLNATVLQVEGYAEVDVGGDQIETLHFTLEDIADRVTKSAGTQDAVQGVASSLASDVDISVRALGLGLGTAGTTAIVGNALSALAPTVDTIFTSLTDALGVKLGTADVTVDRIRCGHPSLVG